jgi:hypothetical protein
LSPRCRPTCLEIRIRSSLLPSTNDVAACARRRAGCLHRRDRLSSRGSDRQLENALGRPSSPRIRPCFGTFSDTWVLRSQSRATAVRLSCSTRKPLTPFVPEHESSVTRTRRAAAPFARSTTPRQRWAAAIAAATCAELRGNCVKGHAEAPLRAELRRDALLTSANASATRASQAPSLEKRFHCGH